MSKLGVPRFEVKKFNGPNDYILCERQVTSVLVAMSLDRMFKSQPDDVDDDD